MNYLLIRNSTKWIKYNQSEIRVSRSQGITYVNKTNIFFLSFPNDFNKGVYMVSIRKRRLGDLENVPETIDYSRCFYLKTILYVSHDILFSCSVPSLFCITPQSCCFLYKYRKIDVFVRVGACSILDMIFFTLTFLPAGWILRNIFNFLAFYHLIKGMCPKICGNLVLLIYLKKNYIFK